MPENEDGFTFVDKRKVSPDDASDSAPDDSVADEHSIEPENAADDSAQGIMGEDFSDNAFTGEAPDTYMLLQYCANLLASDAWMKLGLIADPRTGKTNADLAQAKIAIDAIGDLIARIETAPETALPPSQRRDLRNLLNDLRLNYVNQRSTVAAP